MFRKTIYQYKTDHFDADKIARQVAAINVLSEMLLYCSEQATHSSYLSILMHTINKFEKHRFADYMLNDTTRAEQVLHTRKIYNELYNNELQYLNIDIIADALRHELKDYSATVKATVSAIKQDLSTSLIENYNNNCDKMDAVINDHDFEVLKQQAAAYRLKSKYAEQIEMMNDDENSDTELVSSGESFDIDYDIIPSDPEDEQNYGYGYYGSAATDQTEEFAGTMVNIDDDSFSDDDSMGSVNNSPAASPAAKRFFDFESDSEKDYSSDAEEDSETEALFNSPRSTFSYR